MPNTNFTQEALANDATFRQRLKASLSRIAWQVLGEGAIENHQARKVFAGKVLDNPDGVVSALAGTFVFRTNVNGFATSVAFDGRGGTVVQTAAADADLDSQLVTDWDGLSGV